MYRLTIVLPFFLFLDLFFAVQTRKNLFSVSIIFIVVCGDFVCLFLVVWLILTLLQVVSEKFAEKDVIVV